MHVSVLRALEVDTGPEWPWDQGLATRCPAEPVIRRGHVS